MPVNLSPVAGAAQQFFTNSGVPLSGGLLYTYAAGTTSNQTTYTSISGITAHANPIVLNSAGRVPSGEIWLAKGIAYKFVLKDSNDVLIATYDNISGINDTDSLSSFEETLASSSGSSLVGYQPSGIGSVATTVQSKLRQIVSVQDFGAYGDGSGITPNETGDDISIASWNTWDNTPWKDDPAYSPWYANSAATFQPPRAKPFANDDTWDFIGANLALWHAGKTGKCTYFPAGIYKMNAISSTPKGPFQGLMIMKGQEQTIYGEGPYKSTIEWKENADFFTANNFGVVGAYKLLELYRIGGPPTNIFDLGFSGPSNFNTLAQNITLIDCQNINGVTFRDLWITTGWYGISATTNSGDSHASRITSEFLFGATVYTDAGSEISIDFVNFWASALVPGQVGVYALGRTSVTNSRFVEFFGNSINAASGIISNNLFAVNALGGHVVSVADYCVISGNQFTGSSTAAFINAHKNASITGNAFRQTANHACINLGNGTTATNITINGNTFIKTNAASESQNFAITAVLSGVNFIGAATTSCIIANNTFQGPALLGVGAATMINNTFDSAIIPGQVNSRGDVSGALVTNASGGASFTFDVTGLIGQSQSAARDVRRVTIINVYSNCSGHEVHGVAIYTNDYLGNAKLLGTLGKYEFGGTITFGQSTVYPTVTITNTTGLTANVEVYALPMI